MKITKRQLRSIIKKNLSPVNALNEVGYIRSGSKFNFDFCDLGEIEYSKSYKKFMNFKNKASKTKSSSNVSKLEKVLDAPLLDYNPSIPGYVPPTPGELEFRREELLKKLETAKRYQSSEMETIFDKEFMGYTLGGVKTAGFLENLGFLVNLGAYASMGPAAALYCQTLKNIITVIDAAVDTYTEEYEEKSGLASFSEFDRFYTMLDRSIGFKAPGTLSVVLNSYFSKYTIESSAQKALFKLFFLKELIEFAEANPKMTLTTPTEKEAESSKFDMFIKGRPKDTDFQALIRKLKRKPERNNFTRQIRKYLKKCVNNSGYEDYVKDDSFRMRELERYLADNFIEGDVRRKTAEKDDTSIKTVNDYEELIKDIQSVGASISGIK